MCKFITNLIEDKYIIRGRKSLVISRVQITFLLICAALSFNAHAQHLNNDFLRFGDDNEFSINSSGNLKHPYYNTTGTSTNIVWGQLTYHKNGYYADKYDLDSQIMIGGTGANVANEWNQEGVKLLFPKVPTSNTFTSSSVIDIDNNVASTGSGTLEFTGYFTLDNINFKLTNSYSLEGSNKFIKIETSLTNLSSSTATNIRYWVGTRDDYVGSEDAPKKVRTNIVESSLVTITTINQRSRALEISSEEEGVLFFTTYPNANTAVKNTVQLVLRQHQ